MRSPEQDISEGLPIVRRKGLKEADYRIKENVTAEQCVNRMKEDLGKRGVKLTSKGWEERGRIMRNNGSGQSQAEGQESLLQHAVANCNVSEAEAKVILGIADPIDEKMDTLKKFGFSEADAKIVIQKGYFFQD